MLFEFSDAPGKAEPVAVAGPPRPVGGAPAPPTGPPEL
jgi:hypothetical protein